MLFEDRLIYFPARYPAGDWTAPARSPVPIEDVHLTAGDGTRLHGWYAQPPNATATILYFHGNAGNLAGRYHWVVRLASIPANVLIIDYRGYGKSEGKPNEAGIYLDAEAAYRWLVDEQGVDAGRIVLYGKSLGGAPACELASRVPHGALVLQSTFTSARDMTSVMFPVLPVGPLVRTVFDNVGKVRRVTAPKLIIHSRGDEMIPFRMAEALFANAAEPKRLLAFDRSGHNSLTVDRGAEIVAAFRETIGAMVAPGE